MKHFKQIIIYLSILSFVTVFLFSSNPLKVYAEVPASQKAVAHTGAWSGYPFNYSLLGKYFTITDATGIPTSQPLNAQYFYTDDNVTFYALSGKELYTAILNRGIGIVVTSDFLNLLYNGFMSVIQVTDTQHSTYLQGALYTDNGNFLGYTVNDISGCYYSQPNAEDTPAVDVPDELTDDVYNHYKYYNDTNEETVDYFTYSPPSVDFIVNHDNTQLIDGTVLQNIYNTCSSAYQLDYKTNTSEFQSTNKKYVDYVYYPYVMTYNDCFYINNDYYNWNNFCNTFDLVNNNHELFFSDLTDYVSNHNEQIFLRYAIRDLTTENLVNSANGFYLLSDGSSVTNSNSYYNYKDIGFNGGTTINTPIGKNITIYKSLDVYHDINVDKDYQPRAYPSSIYYNYNPQNDNSITINNIDNSTNNNTDLLNDSNDIFYDNTNNSQINNTTINNDITEIIYIYYPEGNPGPTPPDPENPDNPNIEDDTVLDAILAALKRFFDVIGKILGTVLAGLLEVIDALLESIAGIMDNLTGLTEFLAALFSWIPAPVPQVLAIGFSLCILAAIIKFIRG